MTIGRLSGAISASALGNTSLSACAPKLPPTTSKCSAPLRVLNLASGPSICVISTRTGLPTKIALLANAAGKAAKTFFAKCARVLLVKPATEFCSCITNGLRNSHAIKPPGNAAKPPIPNTKFGCDCAIAAYACLSATLNLKGNSNQPSKPFPRTPRMVIMAFW